MPNRQRRTSPLLLAALLVAGPAGGEEPAEPAPAEIPRDAWAVATLDDETEVRPIGPEQREALSLTVYQRGPALVRERREVGLDQDRNRLVLTGVPAELEPGSVWLEGEEGLALTGLTLEARPLDRDRLLAAHRGSEVRVIRPGGEERARLIDHADDHAVVELEDGVEAIPLAGETRLRLPGIPPEAAPGPALFLEVTAGFGGRQPLDLSYLTRGLAWEAVYTARLRDDDHLDLHAHARIDNRTRTDFPNAVVQLVAGETEPEEAVVALRAEDAREAAREALGDHHLYTLERAVSLGAGRSHQARLLRREALPVERGYLTRGRADAARGGAQPVALTLALDAPAETPLPAGRLHLYGADRDGRRQRLGSAPLPATSAGEGLELEPGRAFDVTAERVRERFRRLDERAFEAEWTVRLANARDEDVEVRVEERVPGDWRLESASLEPAERDGERLVWRVPVAAGGEAEVRYRVEVRR